ncbi:MAG: succinate--CoA ligase subunit alpha [Blastocatellia bacterium]|nr:succinate--CoA ligase subunit alpha [Blastocatellia bacterium]
MGILINEQTRVVIQGITGREGAFVTGEMLKYGTKILAGVTPGKGGDEVHGMPVFDTLKQALTAFPDINTSLIYVPPLSAKDAAIEAISKGIKLVNIITERVPIHDVSDMFSYAQSQGARIVGPTSVGILTPGKCKLGPIGGTDPDFQFAPGRIGIVSKSGSMTSETAWILHQAGFGISTALSVGGDVIACSTFADILPLFEADPETDAVVLFGEPGGVYEEQAAELLKQKMFTKPLVAFIAGKFADLMPSGITFGHAGAIMERGMGSPRAKMETLRAAGALVAEVHHEIPELLRKALSE